MRLFHRAENAPRCPLWSHTWTLGRHLSLSVGLISLILGGVLAAALLALILTHTDEFLRDDVVNGDILYAVILGIAALVLPATAVRFNFSRRVGTVVNTVCVLLMPLLAIGMVECLGGVFILNWSFRNILLNYILYLLFYGIVYVCSGSYRLPMLVMNVLFFALGVTNHYLLLYRGTPFVPMDFTAAGTAANVATAYDFAFDYQMVIGIVLLVALTVCAVRLRTPNFSLVAKVASRTFFAVLAVCTICLYFFTDVYAKAGLSPDFWSQRRGYRSSGTALNFCLNLKYGSVQEPVGYDPAAIEGIVGTGGISNSDKTTPNIICVMNESFSDLSVLGDFETNIEYMPFLNSLRDNTVRGNLQVPSLGASTSNTEFEFLTGAPLSFFPAGSNAYMLYVENPLNSLVSTLGDQGYSKLAFHPYYASGWNRPTVYENLGFEQFRSIGSIIDYDILTAYADSGSDAAVLEQLVAEAYPDEDVLLRHYVSDSFNYREVIDLYENRDPDKPFFLFNVTMQNHGGYGRPSSNFEEDVYITAINGEEPSVIYPKANQYLSLVKASDEAAEQLVAYFEDCDEPTVLCFFGDHQPNLEAAFVEELLGAPTHALTTEQRQQQYITPFYIWANYDIEEREIERLGSNYLSSYLLDIAGVDMPAYNRYLLELSETLPVMNTIGVIDKDGNHYAIGESTPYDDLINDYKKVVYNLVIDTDNRCNKVFTVK